jgi:phage repressor protein C with HTH and peptisase S24 domain
VNNSQIAKRVRLLREQLGLTQSEFALAMEYERSYISNVENDKSRVTERLIKLIEEVFDVNPKWLRDGSAPIFKWDLPSDETGLQIESKGGMLGATPKIKGVWHPAQGIQHYDNDDIVVIPVYNEADAGTATRNYSSPEPIDWIPVDVKWARDNIFFVKIKGDSMEPQIPDKSIVFIDVNQKEIEDGKVYLVEVPYVGATVKRVHIDYKKIVLKPDNSLYKEKEFPLDAIEKEEIRIVGRAIKARIIKNL